MSHSGSRSALLIFVAGLTMGADPGGITVDPGGPLLHRSSVVYPREALAHSIEGTVVLELSLDRNGEVAGATVVGGPVELRRAALESVPSWHYSSEMSLPAKVQAAFTFKLTSPLEQGEPAFHMPTEPMGKVMRLEIGGLTTAARDALAARLPFHEGDPLTPELVEKARPIISDFDSHLSLAIMPSGEGSVVLIRVPGQASRAESAEAAASEPPPNGQQRIRVSAEVMAAKLIGSTPAEYPPLAKQARISGVVHLNVLVGIDGHVANITLRSGHPILVAPAIAAVKSYVYQPTLLNGRPVEVSTQVDVNFPLDQADANP
jgi:TonB family protein